MLEKKKQKKNSEWYMKICISNGTKLLNNVWDGSSIDVNQ